MTIKSIIGLIQSYLKVTIPEGYKNDFQIYIDKINLNIGRVMAKLFIVMETILLIFFFSLRRGDFFKAPNICYEGMYFLMIVVMTIFLVIIKKLERKLPLQGTSINSFMITSASFILFWCAVISILDQATSGQIIVYVVAIISLAVFPFFKPKTLLIIYAVNQGLFLFLMPYFQTSSEILFGNTINSTLFIVIAWIISRTRYINEIKVYNNGNIIKQKNDELKRLNKELEEANLKLEKLSQIDSLTGISNRYVFDTKIKNEWDRCKRSFIPLSLIMIDVDFFKSFNDKYGHQAGDECLKKVASVLSSLARRSSDVVARYGGEEFAIILPSVEREKAREFAELIRQRVEELHIVHEYSPISDYVTISLGVSTIIPSNKSSIEEFIRSSDKALYEAKQRDRNNVVVA